MSVNITEIINMTGSPVAIFQVANSWTGNLFGILLLTIITMSTYYGLRGGIRGEPSREALTAAFFVGSIVSVFFVMLGILDNRFLAATALLFGGALVMLFNR